MIEVDQIVTQQRLAAGDAERFDLVTAVVHAPLEDGLVSVGDLPGDGTQVPDWGLPTDDAVERIRVESVVRNGEPTEWEFRICIGLTAGGRAAAERLAENRRQPPT